MKWLAAIAAFLTVASSVLVSRAQTGPQPPAGSSASPTTAGAAESSQGSTEGGRYYYMEQQNRWYGWKIAIIDVPLMATTFFAVHEGKWGIGAPAAGLFVLGGPAIHLTHQRPNYAALSGIARLALPLGSIAITTVAMKKVDDTLSDNSYLSTSLLVGGLLASAFDVLVLAVDTVEVERRFDAHKGPFLTPMVGASSGAFTIGVQGVGW